MKTTNRKPLVMTMKRGQHLDFSNGASMYVKKGGGNNFRIVLLLPQDVGAIRSQKFGATQCTEAEYKAHKQDMKERYERRKAEGETPETSIELEDCNEVDVHDAPLPKSGAF